MAQQIQTTVLLDAALTSGYRDAFSSANKLMGDLTRQSNALEKELKAIGKEADELDKVGQSSEELRRDMSKLESQIKATNRAVGKFGDAKGHFRNAKIGAAAFKQELSDIVGFAGKAALGIAGIGTAAAVGLSPPPELQEFDAALSGIRAISPGIDAAAFDDAKAQILDLSNYYGQQASEIAGQFQQLTRAFGFEGAMQTIPVALDFQTATGLSIADIEEDLATAKISLGIDTPEETRQFLEFLTKAQRGGLKIDNLDLGDMETVLKRVGGTFADEVVQREVLTSLVFRQVDSFQLSDHQQVFQEEFARNTVITPEMDMKDIIKAQENLQILENYGISAEKGIQGAMEVFKGLSAEQQAAFFEDLSPILSEQTVEIIARGSNVLDNVTQQVDLIMGDDSTLADASGEVLDSWSATWSRIGTIGENSIGILQSRFAEAFGPSIVAGADRLFNFLSANEDKIKNFFTDIHDGVSPVVSKIWRTVSAAWPDIQQFALEVWGELRSHFQAIAPVAKAVGDGIWSILKPVIGFVGEHPKLVSTLLVGLAAWKAYKVASTGVQATYDFLAGGVSLLQGHYHKLTADVLGNQRALGGVGNTALSTGQKFLEMGRHSLAVKFPRTAGVVSGLGNIGRSALAAIPGIAAMGTGLWTALLPVLPIIAAVTAAVVGVGALAYVVYKNWSPIKQFFVDNWKTIRDVLSIVFPPIGILIGLAGVIKQNWEPIKQFFATLWETIKLTAGIAWEGIQFVVLSAVKFVRDVWAGITGFFASVWSKTRGVFLNSPLAPIFEWMVGAVKTVVSPLINFFSDVWGGISDGFGAAVKWITDKFEWLNEKLGKVFGWLKRKNQELKDDLKGVETSLPASLPVVNQEVAISQGTQRVADDSVNENLTENVIEMPSVATQPKIVQETHRPVTVVEAPQIEMPQAKVETPVVEMPELPTIETQAPVIETPVVEMPAVEIPQQQAIDVVAAAPIIETPVVEMPQQTVIETQAVAPVVELPAIETQSPVEVETPTVEMPEMTTTFETFENRKLLLDDFDRKRKSVPLFQSASQPEAQIDFESALAKIDQSPVEQNISPVISIPNAPVVDVKTEVVKLPDFEIPNPETTITAESVSKGILRNLQVAEIPHSPKIATQPQELNYPELPIDQTLNYTETPSVDPQQVSVDAPAPGVPTVEAESDGGTESSVSITNHFVIHQQPGEDGEDLAEKIAEIMRREINAAPGGFLTQ